MRFVKLIVMLAALFLASCANLSSNMRIDGDLLLSDWPRLSIKLKKEVAEMDASGKVKKISFVEENSSPLIIEFVSGQGPTTSLDYYYSLSHIASNFNFYYMGPARFNDTEWARIVHIDTEGTSFYGYFTLKVDDLVFVYMPFGLSEEGIKVFGQYKKTLKMPDEAIQFLNGLFEKFHSFVEIQY